MGLSVSKGVSPIILFLFLLWKPAAPRCARSLGYTFTVTPNGQSWCEIEGQVNGDTLLHYTCGGQKVTLTSVPGMSATQAWNQQRDTLLDLVEELKKALLDIKAELTATSAASATATATVPSKATANRPITSVLPVIATCAITVGLLGWAFR